MKVQERREIIEVLEKLKNHIEDHMEDILFLCNMWLYLAKLDVIGIPIECGFNVRLLPAAEQYLKSQKPTKTLNKNHYNAITYNKLSTNRGPWWLYCTEGTTGSIRESLIITVNREKLDFLNHLIQKLNK